MAYTVNKTNSSASPNAYTVQNGVVNTQTDLSLIGKGYAGYGESIAENFLHLLENFSNTSAPSKPIEGQLWWDSTNSKLKVYNGTSFLSTGGSAPYQSSAPSGLAIISEDEFTPKTSISGFATIKKGITLTTAISDVKFQGTASDSDALGGVTAANYLRSNANDTTSGTLGVVTDSGMTVGADNDLSITVDSSGVIISNTISDTDITFKINDGGSTTTLMTLDGSEARIGIGTTSPSTKLEISGTTTSTAFAGALTGNVTGNVTGNLSSSGANTMGSLTMSGNIVSQTILPDADATYDIGSSSVGYNTVHAKATSAQYADLAEKYETDSNYDVGTVVIFGGEKEVTQSTISNDTRVAGVISEDPAYLMNDKSEGQAIALVGKVKCKVHGMVSKGDLLTTCGTHPGYAQKAISPVLGSVVGKAMENKEDAGESVILISVGRL